MTQKLTSIAGSVKGKLIQSSHWHPDHVAALKKFHSEAIASPLVGATKVVNLPAIDIVSTTGIQLYRYDNIVSLYGSNGITLFSLYASTQGWMPEDPGAFVGQVTAFGVAGGDLGTWNLGQLPCDCNQHNQVRVYQGTFDPGMFDAITTCEFQFPPGSTWGQCNQQ